MTQSSGFVLPDLPSRVWKRIHRWPVDLVERWKYRDSMVPPQSMIFIGSGDFAQIGLEFRKYFIDLAGLRPDNKVLDVGCGLGRMAVPLTDYLSAGGEYWGFDIVKSAVDWCTRHITRKFGHFHFLHSDVYNRHYNPKGSIGATELKFPFNNASFDFVFLTSVFTHMLPGGVENYLAEISRVLRPGGTCFMTFFLRNAESAGLIAAKRSSLDLAHEMSGCAVVDEADPEAALAYSETFVLEQLEIHGLELSRPIQYGSWCGRDDFLTYQDVIIARKVGAGI